MEGKTLLSQVDTYQKASLGLLLNLHAYNSTRKMKFTWKDRMKHKLRKIKKSLVSLFKKKPDKFAILESRFENMEINVLEVENKMKYVRTLENGLIDRVDNEKRLRAEQGKRAKAAMEKHIEKVLGASYKKSEKFTQELVNYASEGLIASCKVLIEDNNKNIKSQVSKCINDAINPTLTKLTETHKKLENRINDIDTYLDKFERFNEISRCTEEHITDLCRRAQEAYNNYREQLCDIDENQFLPKRLASVETRITLLEGCHNGSGKTASGTA